MRRSHRLNLNSSNIFLFFIICIFLTPTYFLTFNLGYKLYYIMGTVLSFATLFFWFTRRKISLVMILIISFYLIIVTITIFNDGPYLWLVFDSLIGIGFCIMLEKYMYLNVERLLNILLVTFEILVYFNFFTVLFFPNGLYTIIGDGGYTNAAFLLGHRNNAIEILIPALGISMIHSYLNYSKIGIRFYFLYLISLLTSIFTWSANSILCLLFVGLYAMVLYNYGGSSKFFNVFSFFIMSAISSYALIILKIQNNLSWIIEELLHKDVTLSSRSFIWEKSIEQIKHSLFLGHGLEESKVKISKIGHISSSHNFFLDYLYDGGLVMLINIIIIIFLCGFQLKKYRKSKISEISIFIYGTYFILWIASPIHIRSLFIMFGFFLMTYHINKIIELESDTYSVIKKNSVISFKL